MTKNNIKKAFDIIRPYFIKKSKSINLNLL